MDKNNRWEGVYEPLPASATPGTYEHLVNRVERELLAIILTKDDIPAHTLRQQLSCICAYINGFRSGKLR